MEKIQIASTLYDLFMKDFNIKIHVNIKKQVYLSKVYYDHHVLQSLNNMITIHNY